MLSLIGRKILFEIHVNKAEKFTMLGNLSVWRNIGWRSKSKCVKYKDSNPSNYQKPNYSIDQTQVSKSRAIFFQAIALAQSLIQIFLSFILSFNSNRLVIVMIRTYFIHYSRFETTDISTHPIWSGPSWRTRQI